MRLRVGGRGGGGGMCAPCAVRWGPPTRIHPGRAVWSPTLTAGVWWQARGRVWGAGEHLERRAPSQFSSAANLPQSHPISLSHPCTPVPVARALSFSPGLLSLSFTRLSQNNTHKLSHPKNEKRGALSSHTPHHLKLLHATAARAPAASRASASVRITAYRPSTTPWYRFCSWGRFSLKVGVIVSSSTENWRASR